MNPFYVLAIGVFIIAGAHYVRDGDTYWYAAYVLAGVVNVTAGAYRVRFFGAVSD
jgi:hypothetical protein